MTRWVAALVAAAGLAVPATAGAASGWVPGFDEVAPSGNMRTPVAVVAPGLRTAAFWVDYPRISAAVRPRGGTFGGPFELDAGDSSYVPQSLGAVALPDGEVVAAWSGPGDQELRIKSLRPDGTIADARPSEPGASRPAIAANSAATVAVAYYYFNQVYLAIRPAGADAFDPSVLLLTLGSNERPAGFSANGPTGGPLDVTIRDDGQVAVAIGTEIVNPPGGTARMLIARRAGGTTSVETVDSRTLTLTQAPGTSSRAAFHGAIELLPDGRQLLAYRLETSTNGSIARELRSGPRDGSSMPAPAVIEQTIGYALGPKEHDLAVDDAGRPWVWWRSGTGSGTEDLRIRQATTAGAFSAPSQVLASPVFGTVDLEAFGSGRLGVLFTQDGKVKASTSEAGAAFGAPVEVATRGAEPPSQASVALAGAGDGSAVAFWPDGATLQASALHATPFDATPPTLSDLAAPGSLTAGVAGTFAATALDDWSSPGVSWLFGDGATLAGASVQRAFPAAGSFTATATATDAVGNTATGTRTVTVTAAPAPPGTQPPGTQAPGTQPPVTQAGTQPPGTSTTADTRPPVLSGVRLAPNVLRRGRRSTTLHFRLDEAATVVAQLERARSGFRSGRRCVARRPRRGTPRRCLRFVRSGAPLRRTSGAGAGRLTIRRPNAPGRYRVGVHAADAAGNRSATQRRALTVR